MTEDFKKAVKRIIEEGSYTDYMFNGEDEIEYDAYDKDYVAEKIISLVKESYESVLTESNCTHENTTFRNIRCSVCEDCGEIVETDV